MSVRTVCNVYSKNYLSDSCRTAHTATTLSPTYHTHYSILQSWHKHTTAQYNTHACSMHAHTYIRTHSHTRTHVPATYLPLLVTIISVCNASNCLQSAAEEFCSTAVIWLLGSYRLCILSSGAYESMVPCTSESSPCKS